MMNKMVALFNVVRTFDNWPAYIKDYFHLLNQKEVNYKLRNGVKFLCRVGTNDVGIVKENWITKPYFYKDHIVKEGDVVVDIGAHIGTFSILASSIAKNGVVFSYEPLPDNYNILKFNVEQNAAKNVKLFRLAIAGKKGKRRLYCPKNSLSNANFYNRQREDSIQVKCVTLKDVFKMNKLKKIDFLKLDCEGTEYEILRSLSKSISKKIASISIETELEPSKIDFLVGMLQDKGFETKVLKRHQKPRFYMIYSKKLN